MEITIKNLIGVVFTNKSDETAENVPVLDYKPIPKIDLSSELKKRMKEEEDCKKYKIHKKKFADFDL